MFNALTLRAYGLFLRTKNSERGQGTLEYVGIVFVAALLILAVVTGLGKGDTIKGAVEDGIKEVIKNAKGE